MALMLVCILYVWLYWAAACSHHGKDDAIPQERLEDLEKKWGSDVRIPFPVSFPSLTSCQWAFSGISTFAHSKHRRCLTEPGELYDIAIIGVPFDTAVTYRTGTKTVFSIHRKFSLALAYFSVM